MECEVRFYGGTTRVVGAESVRVTFEGGSLGELLAELRRRYPPIAPLLDEGEGGPLLLALNGKALEPPDPSLRLKSGDVLSILPFVAGG